MSTLEALRPRHDEAPVTAADPAAALAAILARAEGRRVPRSRRRLARPRLVALTGACLAVAVVVPVVGGRDRPGLSVAEAETLHQLAAHAGDQPTDLAGPGQFRYFKTSVASTMETADGAAAPARGVSEEWIAADGTTWFRHTGPAGQVATAKFGPNIGSGRGSYSPAYLAALPADPERLYKRLREDAAGSSSKDEAVFVAVGDMLRTQTAPPDLRAAAINALAYLPVDVVRGSRTATGTEGVLISMERPRDQGTEALLVDERTSAVVEERHTARYDRPLEPRTSRALSTTSTVLTTRIVDSLPPDLQALSES